MSAISRGAVEASGDSSKGRWVIRDARVDDAQAVAAGISSLLEELGGVPPGRPEMEAVARSLIADSSLGCVLIGEAGETVVAVLAASWQTAIHTAGRYCLIQDLWVGPAWRDGGLGGALVDALCARCRAEGFSRIEVGLPTHRFAGLRRTEAFYIRSRFAPVGTRMRRSLR